ncbi:MAG: PQQ-binding-like beta-propeller repeat protein [Sedimentisphaerales bacterium]|nr:PQQ-binding-like beta-propeller repeat protein [Sedimentisphaerales bacterium]
MERRGIKFIILVVYLFMGTICTYSDENWLQYKYDSRHSGNAPERSVAVPLGLAGATPLTDAIFTAPVVADGHVYIVDGSGVAFCLDTETLNVKWKYQTGGGKVNCNNVSSPAISGKYLHFGTMAGSYYVLDTTDGTIIKEIDCDGPILSTPVVSNGRVYFATLGSRVYALESDGTICWIWDFVKDKFGFTANRWSGVDWLKHKGSRMTPSEQFCCARDIAAFDKTLIIGAGGSVVWLEDLGNQAKVQAIHEPRNTTLGISIADNGTVYRQWTLLDNGGSVNTFQLSDGKVEADQVPETRTNLRGPLLSFCSVSLRGQDVYRCRPEEGFALCRHTPGQEQPERLGGYPSIASPILLRDQAVFGGLDGSLYVNPLSGHSKPWSFKTAFGKAISAPVAVCDGRIYFGCEDGYMYMLAPGGNAPLPSKDLKLCNIRSQLTARLSDPKYDRSTSFGNWANTNTDTQGIAPPFKIRWIRRYEGTGKHFSTFGAGRMYTHTAEGQIFAVEQETGRFLWRRYFPGVHLCYTSPLYYKGRLLIPQAGLKECWLRCLDAATGTLLWEAPFTGSPSWNRQLPPIVHNNMAFYMFSTGKYGSEARNEEEQKIDWLFEHQNIPSFPRTHQPLLRAYNMDDGQEVWTRDFSQFGSGGDDAGICLMDGMLYYSCFFGHSAKDKRGRPSAKGLTAAIDPQAGQVHWLTTKYFIHGGCTICGENGRLYLGGYNKLNGKDSFVWCIDAQDGSMIWKSEPVHEAIQVVTIGPRFLFVHAQYQNGFLLDKNTGKILTTLTPTYKCTRFTLSEPYLLGSNMDVHDLSDINDIKLVSSGPRLDPSECIGTVVSNGRLYYTGHGGGLQACIMSGND